MASAKITGMRCQHCVASVTKALSAISGVTGVAVDLNRQQATFKATGEVDAEMIRAAISGIGFTVDQVDL